ncbi:heterogeneous nuclear ribonucleoprotein R-like [Octopus sinensis]|uniref:Heterogeneous nuclear ribonucleoprotein R-like n=1 Tax=Octopus sinensis TaxID=2607531 RepID=A0A6P7U639_9MOLL|nr:heterogeneous nuclear ribonucleoprotein R-like [Octopus sinensis]
MTDIPAANGHEIYIGSIPYSVCEDTLIPMMEKCGTIYDLRMMVDAATGRNKGFCFVTFVEDDAVDIAVKKYNGVELKAGMKIRVNPSIPNLKLSLSNLPMNKEASELMEEFNKLLDGVLNVELTGPGCCTIHFDRHKNASSSKRKLFTGRVRPFDQLVGVDWFVVNEENGEEDVKVLFVRNIDADMSDAEYSDIFSRFGSVMRINRFTNHLFVHYVDRKAAEKALGKMDKKVVFVDMS